MDTGLTLQYLSSPNLGPHMAVKLRGPCCGSTNSLKSILGPLSFEDSNMVDVSALRSQGSKKYLLHRSALIPRGGPKHPIFEASEVIPGPPKYVK